MSTSAGLSKRELNIAVQFLMEFGMGWVENNKVREFIATQSDGVFLHKFLENKVDPQYKYNGLTHRRLNPDILDQINSYKDEAV